MTTETTHTALIVPGVTEMASQCRIYARRGKVRDALQNYRAEPREWREVGLMNSRGELVCCEPYGDLVKQLKECEPLRAGFTLDFTAPDAPF